MTEDEIPNAQDAYDAVTYSLSELNRTQLIKINQVIRQAMKDKVYSCNVTHLTTDNMEVLIRKGYTVQKGGRPGETEYAIKFDKPTRALRPRVVTEIPELG